MREPPQLKSVLSIRLSLELMNQLRGIARNDRRTLSTTVTILLEEGLKKRNVENTVHVQRRVTG